MRIILERWASGVVNRSADCAHLCVCGGANPRRTSASARDTGLRRGPVEDDQGGAPPSAASSPATRSRSPPPRPLPGPPAPPLRRSAAGPRSFPRPFSGRPWLSACGELRHRRSRAEHQGGRHVGSLMGWHLGAVQMGPSFATDRRKSTFTENRPRAIPDRPQVDPQNGPKPKLSLPHMDPDLGHRSRPQISAADLGPLEQPSMGTRVKM